MERREGLSHVEELERKKQGGIDSLFTHSKNISREGRKNRDILIEAMTQAGFANLRTEWWHWSFGNQVWAYYANQPYARYGPCKRE